MIVMVGKIRLFWAVNLPGEIKAGLGKIQQNLKISGADAGWVDPRNLHVTVKFLGDTDAALAGRIVESAGGLGKMGTLRLEAGGLGFFPGPVSPRVLWVGLRGEVNRLGAVARMVEDSMGGLGFSREGRRFSPHITLARIRSPRGTGSLVEAVKAEGSRAERLGAFEVLTVDLMQSGLRPGGPVYTVLATVKFSGQGR